MSPGCDVATMGQGAGECPRQYAEAMSVREHLQRQLDVACRVRWFLMIVLAAVLVCLYPEHSVNTFKRFWMCGAFLLYFWFLGAVVGTLLDIPLARPRCPLCAAKLTLGPRVTSCPVCGVSFDAKVAQLAIHVDYPNTLADKFAQLPQGIVGQCLISRSPSAPRDGRGSMPGHGRPDDPGILQGTLEARAQSPGNWRTRYRSVRGDFRYDEQPQLRVWLRGGRGGRLWFGHHA
jgi:hypothetical protein